MPDTPAPSKDVNVPAVGKVDRKWLLAGGAAVAGIAVYAYWRSSRVAPATPGEGDQYAAGDDYTPDAYVGATAPGGETYDPNDGTTNIPTTNAEWSQRVVDALVSMAGYTPELASQTVGKYLAGQPLTLGETMLIQTAIALMGNPPAGALPIISAPTAGGVVPTPTPTATKLTRPVLRVGAGDPRNTIYQLACNKVPGAIYYDWKRTAGPGAPTSYRTIGPARKTAPLQRGAHYSYQVRAIAPPGKTSSDPSNTVSFTVPRR